MKTNTIAALLGGLAAAGLSITACYYPYDNYYAPLTDPALATGGAGGGTGGSGGTGGTDPGCIPSQTPNPVRADCGVFVSASKGTDDSANDPDAGSPAKPFKSIDKALTSSAGPIYLCAETFSEAVQIKAGAVLYGGLDCTADWAWIGTATKTTISPDAGKVPLVLDPGVGATLEDVAFVAKDAADAGGSSIAIIATSGSDLELARCDVEAGAGKDGAAGEALAMSAPAGAIGNSGLDACTAAIVLPGASVTNACDEGDLNDDSISGSGGIGQDSSGGAGSPGQPEIAANGGAGEGGLACTGGGPGDVGEPGTPGAGATGTGTFSAQGYSGPAGTSGTKGKPGQGGGGGGGAKGGTGVMKCPIAGTAGGASGASGGSGGCGGLGGLGGQAGGASIGIVSLGATLTFIDVKISTKNGGKGGDGGPGQTGGDGGEGGIGGAVPMGLGNLKPGCSGGKGGSGGIGGKGGGGLGGHSIGIAHDGSLKDTTGATIVTGVSGTGGLGDPAAGNGDGEVGITAEAAPFN